VADFIFHIYSEADEAPMNDQSKMNCPVLVAQEGSALWRNTLATATALLHDHNSTIPLGLIEQVNILLTWIGYQL